MTYIMFAKWFGLISILLSLGILFNLEDAKKMAGHMINNESGYIMGGVLPIIFGSMSCMMNHSFEMSWQLVVTLIGLAMVFIGAFRVLFVGAWRRIMLRHLEQIPSLFSLFGLIFGLLMLYVGFLAPVVAYNFGS